MRRANMEYSARSSVIPPKKPLLGCTSHSTPSMIKPLRKLFVVKKYVYASSAEEALRREKRVRPDDVWIDEDWKKANSEKMDGRMGFIKPKIHTHGKDNS